MHAHVRTLQRNGWSDFVFAFHDGEEIGPKDALSHRQAYGPYACRFVEK
jgi:hypothetical protein